MKRKSLIDVAILGAVPFVMVLGNSMLIPVFPKLKQALDISQFQVGLLITVFSAPAALVIPFAGLLSDHIGRRKVIGPALIVYGIGGLIAGAAALLLDKPYAVVLVGRVIQGIGAGGTYLLAVALAGDLFTGRGRTQVLGILEAANGIGKVVSPILGAAIALIAWWTPFFLYGLLALPIAFLVWFVVDEPELKEKRSMKEYGQALLGIFQKRGVPLTATYFAGMAALFLLFGVLSFLSDELETRYGIKGFSGGLVLAIPVATMAATAYTAGTYFQNNMRMLKPVILASSGLAAVSLAAAAFFTGLWPFMTALALLGIAIGSMLPAINMLITSAAGQEERGIVTSLYGAVRFIGVAIGPPVFALALAIGRGVTLGAAAVLAAIVLGVSWWLITPDKLLVATDAGGGDSDSSGGAPNRTGSRRRRRRSGPLQEVEGEG